MSNETYLSVSQAADLLGISQETLYKEIQSNNLNDQLTTVLQNNKTLSETNASLTKTLDNLTTVLENMT